MRKISVLFVSLLAVSPQADAAKHERIRVGKVLNRFTVTPVEITTHVDSVVEWSSGKTHLSFRIEFVGRDPCDRHSSRLDRVPATCVLSGAEPGDYKYNVTAGITPDIGHGARCENCAPPPVTLPTEGRIKIERRRK
jgi:hypothetical protein